eukprot:SAG11_NODE_828_length_6964_cov_34.418063_2_plen_1003_part_00
MKRVFAGVGLLLVLVLLASVLVLSKHQDRRAIGQASRGSSQAKPKVLGVRTRDASEVEAGQGKDGAKQRGAVTRDLLGTDCLAYFDGCNQCHRVRLTDGFTCTKKFCLDQVQPRCSKHAAVSAGSKVLPQERQPIAAENRATETEVLAPEEESASAQVVSGTGATARGRPLPGREPVATADAVADDENDAVGATTGLAEIASPAPSAVAVIIVGLQRELLVPSVFESQQFLLRPLQAEFDGRGGVHLYLCVDAPNAAGLRAMVIGGAMAPTAVFEHTFEGRHNQWPRMSACYRDIKAWASAPERDLWRHYEWIVRSRPDNVFFAPVPGLSGRAKDAVHGRVRRFGGYQNVGDESLSWWHYEGKEPVCGAKQEGLACRWWDTREEAAGAQCVLLDDQFGYIPAGGLAEAYFGVAETKQAQTFRHVPLVEGNHACQWPEGTLTCRVLGSVGGRLEPLEVSIRIVVMTKLNNGNAPPTTHPRKVPHVCKGVARLGVGRAVAAWSVDDTLIWLVDSVRIAGARSVDYRAKLLAAELNGARLLGLLSSSAGSAEDLAAALGVTDAAHLARLSAAVDALPVGKPTGALKALVDARNGRLKGKAPDEEGGVAKVRQQPLAPQPALMEPAELGRPSSSAPSAVAVIIVGLQRELLVPSVFESQQFLLRPLQAEFDGRGGVHLYLCVDAPNAAGLRAMVIGGAMAPTAVFEHTFEGRHNQWPRMSACYRDIKAWASAPERDLWRHYEWIVRSRPDNVFFAPVPGLSGRAKDAVHGRVRRFGGYQNVGDESLSWWHYEGKESVCGAKQEGLACRWWDTREEAAGAQCVLLDDQFGYIPAGGLAEAYFGVAETKQAQTFRHVPLVEGNHACQWPEGTLTCRVLGSVGGRLEPLEVSIRIVVMTKLNNGNAPPTTHPRKVPHVCKGVARLGVGRAVAAWSVDDTLIWLVDSVRIAGARSVDYRAKLLAAELNGARLLGLLSSSAGSAEGLAAALGVTDAAHLARLSAAVDALSE